MKPTASLIWSGLCRFFSGVPQHPPPWRRGPDQSNVEHVAKREIDGWSVVRRIRADGVTFEFIADDTVYILEADATKAAQDMQDQWVLFVDELDAAMKRRSA